MRKLQIVYRDFGSLTPYGRNARRHGKKQIRQIAKSIRKCGFIVPILIDSEGTIMSGHARVEAAKREGIRVIPTICVEGLTEAEKRIFIIADNRLTELAEWDEEMLGLEFQSILQLDNSIDLTISGFEVPEIDLVIEGLEPTIDDDPEADAIPEDDPNARPTSCGGDLWKLGDHHLLCGNAMEFESFERLMAGEKAQMVFIDSPYNLPIDGHVCGLGTIKHKNFMMASGEMTEAEFTAFLKTVCLHLVEYSVDGSIHFIFMDWRHLYPLLKAGRSVYQEQKNLCVWSKSNAGMGSFYRSQHELIVIYKSGTASHINNFELGQHGRYRTNVWRYPGINSLGQGRLEELRMHPTVKPVALVADAIRDCSTRGAIVLDCFVGSGTTLIAAEKTGRRAYTMEIDPKFVDTAVRRWESYTGEAAILDGTGLTFAEVADERGREVESSGNDNES